MRKELMQTGSNVQLVKLAGVKVGTMHVVNGRGDAK